ncbi:MAG: aldo/keto reductase [Acidothermaceae bacterium]
MTQSTPASSVPTDTVRLPSGRSMPLLGFGTWQLTGRTAHDSVCAALDVGYRHIDTATMYGNEGQVGAALRESGLPRDDVFITSKLAPDRFGRYGIDLRIRGRRLRPTLEQSLEQLAVPQLDLWLVHWPPRSDVGGSIWEQFVAAREDGLVRDIGVSNYSLEQLDELTARTGVTPAVNQIHWSPSLFDRGVVDGHRERGVVLEGYSGLKGGVLTQPAVVQVADRLGRTPAQVVIRWHLDHSVVVIPRSRDPQHIRTNGEVAGFRLSESDVAVLDALGR